jgi:hypothetical protein
MVHCFKMLHTINNCGIILITENLWASTTGQILRLSVILIHQQPRAAYGVPEPSDDTTPREDEDPLEPGDLDLVLAPQVEEEGSEGGESEGGGEGGETEER